MAFPLSSLVAQNSEMNKNTVSGKATQNVVILAPVQAVPVGSYQASVDKKTVSTVEINTEKTVELPAQSAIPASSYKSSPKSTVGQIKSESIELLPRDVQRQPSSIDNK